jgi:hypothetical protein
MLTADGCAEVAIPEETGCCPPPLCGNDLCCTFVAFMNLLPSGPLWDYWKQAAISYFETDPEHPEECPLIQDPQCPSLVLHAIYTVLKLRHVVHNALWPALRESNPATAVITLDNHLSRLQWEDCYSQHCRSVLLGEITPYEIWTSCGPVFCEPDFPPELEAAVKRGIAIALTRANMGVIKNMCGINWVIESLGAAIRPSDVPVPTHPIVDPCNDCADNIAFELYYTQDWLEGVGSGDICETNMPRPHVPAFWDRGCDKPAGLPDQIWPGVLAAECIVRSMMHCPIDITRKC